MGFKPQRKKAFTPTHDFALVNKYRDEAFDEVFGEDSAGGLIVGVISSVIDLGIQEREDFKDNETGEVRELDPCQQVAFTIDFPEVMIPWDDCIHEKAENVEKMGTKPYRLLVNNNFQGAITGIPYTTSFSYNKEGERISDVANFSARSKITTLAKAAHKAVIDPDHEDWGNIALLAGKPVLVNLELKRVKDKVYEKMASFAPARPKDLNDIDLSVVDTLVVDLTEELPSLEEFKTIRFGLRKMLAKSQGLEEGNELWKLLEESGIDVTAERKSFDEKPNSDSPPEDKEEKPAKTGGDKPASPNDPDDFDDDIPF